MSKTRDPNNWRSFLYELTEKGRDLAPVLAEIVLWSGKYNLGDNAMKGTLEKVLRNRSAFEENIRMGRIP